MSPFASILLPLDGSASAARAVGVSAWLAARLDARLHILTAVTEVLPTNTALARLKVPREYWAQIELHQAPVAPEEAILDAVERHAVELLVMSARGEAADDEETSEPGSADPLRVVGHVTRAIIEHSPVPVLLLPPAYRERLPWKHALVPISGEPAADVALALAVDLANALGVSLHVAHVSDGDSEEGGITAAAHYADALHHEYPGRLDELVARALPHCRPEECRCIEAVALSRGDVAGELLRLIDRTKIDLIVVGWQGQFMTGHAEVLKRLLQTVTCPLLLVKPPPARRPFRLKVGQAIE